LLREEEVHEEEHEAAEEARCTGSLGSRAPDGSPGGEEEEEVKNGEGGG
jgi:hypothetical protein